VAVTKSETETTTKEQKLHLKAKRGRRSPYVYSVGGGTESLILVKDHLKKNQAKAMKTLQPANNASRKTY